jgi:threonine/homoserine/homoserine lactone efflux protein
MLDWGLIAWGIIIGIAVAAPIGPVNLICIRNALARGFSGGVVAGFGAVLGDGTFAAAAAFSLTALSDWFVAWADWLQGIGAAVLIGLGLRTFLVTPNFSGLQLTPPLSRLFATLCTTYLLTITNPATMMGFAAIFGAVDGLLAKAANYGAAFTLVAAVMAGSLLWWVVVSWIAAWLKHRITASRLALINKFMGFLIFVFGVFIGLKLAAPWLGWLWL